MKAWRHLELAVIEEVTAAWYPHFVNRNDYLHFRKDWGCAVIIGFTNKAKADRWLRKHYPDERQNIALRHFSTWMASMLWLPHLMIIRDIDLEWDLEKIKQYDADEWKVDGRLIGVMPEDEPGSALKGIQVTS